MPTNKLLTAIKPLLLCKQLPSGTSLKGEVSVKALLNLNAEIRKNALSPITYDLQFYLDGENRPVVKGEISGDFELICQRCMEPFKYTMQSQILVSPVNSDVEAKQLPDQYEPLLMDEGEVNLLEWIAEEIHLALPLVPRHEEVCISHDSYIQNQTGE